MIQVVQAFDRAPISQPPGDDAAALQRKFAIASKLFKDRKSWLKPHQRMDVLRKLAALMEAKREHFGRQIARESGKPYTDALIETDRAIDGVRNACDILRTWAAREIPMGLTAASDNVAPGPCPNRSASWRGISAFKHPLNLIVRQVTPAIATGCPVIGQACNSHTPQLLRTRQDGPRGRHAGGWVQTFLPEEHRLSEAFAMESSHGRQRTTPRQAAAAQPELHPIRRGGRCRLV